MTQTKDCTKHRLKTSHNTDSIYIYVYWDQARASRAQRLAELYYGIVLRDYITELYYRIILLDNITELYYRVLLQDNITELYYEIILRT